MESYQETQEKFPDADSFMYGRGIIARPYLLDEIMCGTRMKKEDRGSRYKQKMRQFHDRLYREYQEYLSGERNVLFRMKELWSYMAPGFTNYAKYLKKIKKSQHLDDYEAAVMSLFGRTGDFVSMDIKKNLKNLLPSIPFLSIVCWTQLISKCRNVYGQSANRNVSAMAAPGPVPRQ